MDISGYVLETLREGGEFALCRGRQQADSGSILVLVPVADRPTPASLKRLEHEYALAAELDPGWAAQPLAITHHDGRTMLVLEDTGGEPLDRVPGQSLELTRFLRIAIDLAKALGQIHRRGLIHKDIKPANVIIDADGSVRLTGFGIASRLPRERQVPAPPEVIAGTLAYMAPEQTGRMNRSMDARSDLYSLGVTFYEILTGTLPFSAADPLEWVHCHIARQPVSPDERTKEVPGALSAIIMKLLAKTAEERYQTAAGLEADLRRCLAEWESHGRIDPFPLGAHDASDRLLIPETLYGREPEIAATHAALWEAVHAGLVFQQESAYRLSLELAECELLCGGMEKAAQLIVDLLQRAASDVEFADASCLKINLHVLTGEHPVAIDSAIACLRRFGIDLPAHPTLEQVRAEYETAWQALNGRPIESLSICR
jgi:hypothetical protein